MSRTVFNAAIPLAFAAVLGGCGLVQSVKDTTTSTTEAIFYRQVKTLHLDLSARTAMNTESTDMSALSVPTLVRIYQLRDSQSMQKATYDDMVEEGHSVLGADLLDERSVVAKPGEGVQLDVPLSKDARFVAVVALFREPDSTSQRWRLILTRDELEPDRPRVIELGDNRLTLRPLARE
jgi:type VI secretion system protein VasD